MFLTAPSGTVQIPVSAVQLHQVGGAPSIPASQPLLYLDLGNFITGCSEPRSLARRPVCFPGQAWVVGRPAGGQAGGSLSWPVSSSPPPPPHTPPSLQMAVIGQQAGSSSNLTELQVVNLDAAHSTKSD